MKRTFVLSLIFAMTAIFAMNLQIALADTTDVDQVVSFSQGLTKDGSTIDSSRSDPNEAMGPADGVFVSLGYGGEIILSFPTYVGGSLYITTYETTWGTYPEENADVYVSDNGTDWSMIGTADNLTNAGSNDPHPTTFDLSGSCIKYVKLIDTTDSELHVDSSDGFDVDAVSAEYTEECFPPEEDSCTCEECDDIVMNENCAIVINEVEVYANTGDNMAGGSYGGDGGDGGKIININDGDVDESTTGNGGNGGDASVGGTVITGDATAEADVMNAVNTNRTIINRCACEDEDCECGFDIVKNRNSAMVMNGVGVAAETGENLAEGSYGGDGGDGGKIYNGGGECSDVDESTTGNGGDGGQGSEGGLVQTGVSYSRANVVNVVNRNLTRILR